MSFRITDHRRSVNELKIDVLADLPEKMVFTNPIFQMEACDKELVLESKLAARHGKILTFNEEAMMSTKVY